MLAPHVSRAQQRGALKLESASNESDDPDVADGPHSTIRMLELRTEVALPEEGCPRVCESERRRLMDDIIRLMTISQIPEATRIAGLTLVGWLARRRVDEAPHAIGISEARESERRLRSKAR
jgi:hypothetical protein